jgi:hypothetical protein
MPMPDARAPRATIRTLSALALAAVSLLAGGLGAPRASAAAGQPVSGLTAGPSAGQITSGTTTAPPSGSSGWCLDNSGGSASAGNAIDIYSCNDTWDAQMWTVEDDGTLRIQNMCLDVKGGSSANGTPVLLNTCNGSGSPGEQWQPQANGSLLNVNSGKCLGISGTVGNGATAMIWSCDGADTQVWNLPLPAPGPAAASAAARLQLMYDPGDGLFDPSGDCTKVTAPAGNCWWWSANELNALIDFGWQERALTMSTAFPGWYAFQNDLSVTFATYADGCTPSSTDTCTGLFTHDGFFDDAGWWGLTWLNAYNYTGDAQYLYLAENILGYIHGQGWDPSSCGGGVWQDLNTGAVKDAIANELYLELAARLYRATGNSAYLGYANAEWAWFKANLIVEVPQTSPPTVATAADLASAGSDLLVSDHVSYPRPAAGSTTPPPAVCPPVNGQMWSYNQGMILGGLDDMYKITGNAAGYLTPAQAIANTVEGDTQVTAGQPAGTYSTPALVDVYGTLSEACQALESPGDWPDDCDVTGPHQYFLQFKGVFIRNLACLSQDAAGSPAYASFIGRNATSVLDADQDTTTTFGADPDLNLFGFLWDNNGNPWPGTETAILNEATQGSALDALVANVGASYAMC